MKNKLILVIILLTTVFFRFFNLEGVPPAASLDEASIGWNAYSIMQTGKDEYGEKYPILLRAYDDWRPALYVYVVIPFLKLFDLNVLAVRLPSVILSVATVLASYFLIKELFKSQKILKAEYIALLSSFLLAISPWHIYISRLGHEVNLGISFLIFGLLFFFKNRIYLSAIFFVLSFMSYQTEKVFIPLLVIGLAIIFKDKILQMKRSILLASIVSLVALVPFMKASFSDNALIRFSGTNVFDQKEYRYVDNFLEFQRSVSEGDLIGQLIHNKYIVTGQIFLEGYLSHFNPVWLFTNEMGDPHKVPNLGLLYAWEFPFILIGIYVLIRFNFDPKIKRLIFLWFLLSPLAASLATQSPHALRSFVFLPTWQIFSALGLLFFFSKLKTGNTRRLFLFSISILTIFSISYFFENYFKVFPRNQAESFQLSLHKAIDYVKKNESRYNKVIFTNHNNLSQSYMFWLFNTKYDPNKYLQEGGTKSGGYEVNHKFGKYEFRKIYILEEENGNLYIGNYNDFPATEKDLKRFNTLQILKDYKDRNIIRIVTK